jgi:threonine dehydratase
VGATVDAATHLRAGAFTRRKRVGRPKVAARPRDDFSTVRAMVHATGGARLSVSLQQIQRASQRIDSVFLHTPQFLSEPLSAQLGCALTLKVESVNPVRSFKGRGASFFVDTLDAAGPLVCASAGNFGQALAWACRRRVLSLVVDAARGANPLKLRRMQALGAA